MLPVCFLALRVRVCLAVLAGDVAYLVVMKLIGGFDFRAEAAGARGPMAITRV